MAAGLTIFLLGLAKKVVLADTFARFADVGFDAAAHGAPLTFFEAWYAAAAYALQIYFDFSGYSDMAIGLARCSRAVPAELRLPVQGRQHHRVLAPLAHHADRFLRDYLYIPLGGNRHGRARDVNLMATMLLGGLWHGAAGTSCCGAGCMDGYLLIHRWFPWRLPAPDRADTDTAGGGRWPGSHFAPPAYTRHLAMFRGMAGLERHRAAPDHGPPHSRLLAAFATPVPLLPYLADARTLSFPEVSAGIVAWLADRAGDAECP